MPRRAPNMIEAFEMASRAKKIVAVEELGQRLSDIFEGRAKMRDYRLRPMPRLQGQTPRVPLYIARSDAETYEWVRQERPSRFMVGTRFKSGLAIAYDALIDMAHGYEVDPQMLLSAFDRCDNHAAHLKAGHLKMI